MSPRAARLVIALAALAGLVALAAGCGPTQKDVARYRDTGDDGPEHLATIVSRSSGGPEVQKEAAVALVTLTRRDRHVGLEMLASALAARSPESRAPLLEAVSAELVKGMALPRGEKDDPAVAFKDGAYLLYARDLATGAAKETLRAALDRWLRESPMERLDDLHQRYGLRSLVHALGTEGAKALSRFLDRDYDYRRVLEIILEEGDAATKQAAGAAVARRVSVVRTPAWRESMRPEIDKANRAAALKLGTLQVDAQLRATQSSELNLVFQALERVEQPEATAALMAAGEDGALATPNRVFALGILGKRAASLDDAQIDRVIAIATTSALTPSPRPEGGPLEKEKDAPGPHYDTDLAKAALACAARSESARPKLLALVQATRSWRLRMVAASVLLHDAAKSAIEEVLARLPARGDVPMAMAEIATYAAELEATAEGKAAARAHLADASLGARLVALATLHDDASARAQGEKDEAPLPRCGAADECEWRDRDGHAITTVRQYVALLESPPAAPRGGHGVDKEVEAATMKILGALTGDAGAAPPASRPAKSATPGSGAPQSFEKSSPAW